MDERQNLLDVLDNLESAFDDDPFTLPEEPPPAAASVHAEGDAPPPPPRASERPAEDEAVPIVRAAIGDDFEPIRRHHRDPRPQRHGFVPVRTSTATYLEHLYRMENL